MGTNIIFLVMLISVVILILLSILSIRFYKEEDCIFFPDVEVLEEFDHLDNSNYQHFVDWCFSKEIMNPNMSDLDMYIDEKVVKN